MRSAKIRPKLVAPAVADSRMRAAVGVERIVEVGGEPVEACFVAVVDAAGRRRRNLQRRKESCHPVGFLARARSTPQSVFRGRLFGFARWRVRVASRAYFGQEDRERQDFRSPCSESVDQPLGPSVGYLSTPVDRTDWI